MEKQNLDLENVLSEIYSHRCVDTHLYCKQLCQLFDITEDKYLTNEIFKEYLKYLYKRKCYTVPLHKKTIYKFIHLDHIIQDEEDLRLLADFTCKSSADYYYTYGGYYSNKYSRDSDRYIPEEIVNANFIIYLCEKNIKMYKSTLIQVIHNKNNELCKYLLRYVVPDHECLEQALIYKMDESIISDMVNKKVEITCEALNRSLSLKNVNIVKMLLDYGPKPTIDCLNTACIYKNKEIIELLLSTNLDVKNVNFKNLFEDADRYYIENINSIIELLIKYGYVPTYDDVAIAIDNRCKIDGIETFNIVLDDNIYKKCILLNYYPYKKENFKPTMEHLYMECQKVSNVANVKKLVKIGLVPDIECLRRACNNKNNIQMIKYLTDTHNLVPDKICFENMAQSIGNPTLTQLLCGIEMNNTKKNINKYKKKINKEDNYKLPLYMTTILKLDKGTVLSCNEICQKINDYINENNLLDESNHDIVKPDKNIKKIFKLKNNEDFAISDLNNMVLNSLSKLKVN